VSWDQAQALRQLAHDRLGGGRARIVAVTSGKGGVGKTNVAVNLAVRLTQMGRRVILLDADLGTANADVLCNLCPAGNLAHVVAGRMTLAQALVEAPGGFGLIPGASGLAQMAALGTYERDRLVDQMQQLEAAADVLLVDTGAGIGPNTLGFVVGADQQLVVTTPEPTAVTDAYAVIKTAARQRRDLDVRVLVNMAKDSAEAKAVFARLQAVCRKFLDLPVQYAGYIPTDARVPAAVRRRRPFVLEYPLAPASASIGQLAHRMDRHAIEPQGQGLLRRMATWLALPVRAG
jgi:flagellar biosynthesis protein FlhG